MPTIEFEGHEFPFPDNFSQEQIRKSLTDWQKQYGSASEKGYKEPGFFTREHFFGESDPAKRERQEALTRQRAGAVMRGIPVLGAYEPTVGEMVRPGYKQEAAQFQQQHPYQEATGGAFGGLLSTAPFGMVAPLARATGMTGTLPQMLTRGALTQGALSGADVAARGGDTGQIAASTGLGLGIGGGVPFLGPAARAVARSRAGEALAAPFRGAMDATSEAARRVAIAIGARGGMVPREFGQARQAGAPVNLLDLGGEPAAELARGMGGLSPEARTTFKETLDNRFNTQNERMSKWLGGTLHYPDEAAQSAALEAAERPLNDERYKWAYGIGSTVKISGELLSRPSVQRAMRKALSAKQEEEAIAGYGPMNTGGLRFTPDGRLQFHKGTSGVPIYPDLQYWDLVRRELSSEATQAKRKGATTVYRRLTDAATKMNAELDAKIPEYAEARAGHAGLMGSKNALEAGRDLARSGTKAAQMPTTQLQRVLADMVPEQRQLLQDGYTHDLVRQVRGSADRLNVLNKLNQSPTARERNQLILGSERAGQLETMLRIEAIMEQTRQNIQRYPGAARQLKEIASAAAVGSGLGIYEQGWDFIHDPKAQIATLLTYGALRGRTVINQRVANEVARLLTSNNLQEVQQGLQGVARNPQMLESLRSIGTNTVRELVRQSVRPHITITPGQHAERNQQLTYGGPQE
jgi:hypothetical protein